MGQLLNCHESGSGSAVVLLHAFPLDGRMWAGVAARLAPSWRVLAVDLPGFGGSKTVEAASIDDMADAVAALLDARGVPSAVIVGLSMGGYVALSLVGRREARVGALVLADTRATADTEAARASRDAARSQLAQGGKAAYLDTMIPRQLADPPDPVSARTARALADAQPAPALAAALLAMRERPDRSALLATLSVPTLCLVGSDDRTTPPAEVRQLADAIPGAAWAEIPGAGHLSALEAPDAFAAAVSRFLTDAIGPGARPGA